MENVIAAIGFALYIAWLLWTFGIMTLRSLRTNHDSRFRPARVHGVDAMVMPLVYLGLILVGIGALLAIWRIAIVALPNTLGVVLACLGVVVAVGGVIISIIAQRQLSDSWRVGVDATETTALINTGLFSVVRNPFFSGTILLTVGMTLVSRSPLTLLGAICFAVGVTIQVARQEEPALEATHGDTYREYKQRTGRFLPRSRKHIRRGVSKRT